MEEKKVKKNKVLILIISIISVLVVGFGGYYAYDNFFKNSDKDSKNNNIEARKLNEEEIEDLYNFLISDDGSQGIYSKNKITKDSNNRQFLAVLFLKYIKENNVGKVQYSGEEIFTDSENKFNYTVSDIKNGNVNVSEKDGFILKDNFYKWVKETYNISLDNKIVNFESSNNSIGDFDELFPTSSLNDTSDIADIGNYFVYFWVSASGMQSENFRKIFKTEYVNNNFIIYDKIIVMYLGEDQPLYNSYDNESSSYIGTGKNIEVYNLINEYESKLINYKHTFEMDSNGNYIWVSSEPLS